MGILHKSAASISFFGNDLDPANITASLGSEPSVSAQKGGLWLTAKGEEKVASTGSWRLVAERREPGDIDGQINDLLNRLSSDLPVWRAIAERYRGRIFCGLFLASDNEGMTLSSTTLVRVGQRGLLIDLDIYGQDMPN